MSCRQNCGTSTVSGVFSNPSDNLSLKSWRVRARAWSLIQVRPSGGVITDPASLIEASWHFKMIFSTTRTVSSGIGSEEVQPFSLSLEAEMMLEQLKEQHLRETEDLRNLLQNKVSPGDSLPFLYVWLQSGNFFLTA